jgi:hypothetical protein
MTLLVMIFVILASVPAFNKITNSRTDGFLYWIRLMTGFAMIPALISFYSFYTFLFARYLSKRNFLGFCLLGILVSIIAAAIGALAESTRILFGPRFLFDDGYTSAFSILVVMSFGAFVNGIIGAILKGFITWYNDIKPREYLLRKNYEIELNLIKSQLNPHFLFNTLNNIDVLIEKDWKKASGYVKILSDILRFMIYETKTEKIPVSRELMYIEKYIDLQKLRNDNPLFIDYQVIGEPGNRLAEPMLFIPFIENAFKHAGNNTLEHAIRIHFNFTGDDIIFLCENNHLNGHTCEINYSGLGNELIEKHLALLYPGRHKLNITNDNSRYIVRLIIENKHDLYHN